jgi:hypothetical protein
MIKYNLLILCFCATIFAQTSAWAGEREHQVAFCEHLSGKTEIVLEDKTRADCLTDEYAFEVDYAKKWAEAFGQAWHYSLMTNLKPGVVLIAEDMRDLKHVARLTNLVIASDQPFQVWLMIKGKPILFIR